MMPNPDPSFMPVAAKRCDRCLLSSRPLVGDERRREILAELSVTGRAFICHKATMVGEYVICRGVFDEGLSLAVVLAKELDVVRFVELPA